VPGKQTNKQTDKHLSEKKGRGYYLNQTSCVFCLSEGKVVDTKEFVGTILVNLVNKVC
jgi:hypothetical protein